MINSTEIILDEPFSVLTGGDGLWSKCVKPVEVTSLVLDQYEDSDGKVYGSLNVYFDPDTWDVETDGLIYTDRLFISILVECLLKETKILKSGGAYFSMDYSEQGMQGPDYVNFDVDADFCESWNKYLVDNSQK